MGQSKLIARVLYNLLRVIAISNFCVLIYSLFCIVTDSSINISENEAMLYLLFPFSENIFLIVENNMFYIICSFTVPLLLYALFFYFASNVFRVFTRAKLFTKENVKHLRLFYRSNLFIPFPVTLFASFFVEIPNAMWVLILVHFILGILIYFLSEIFMQGIGLQNEQELYI